MTHSARLSHIVFPEPYWCNKHAMLYLGDVCECLRLLPDRSVHCCVTSPPYWGLRDYGVGSGQIGCEPSPDCKTWGTAQCGKCFVCAMVGVFSEVWRVLRDDGVVWLNLGDSYAGNGCISADVPNGNLIGIPWRVALALQESGWMLRSDVPWVKRSAMPESMDIRPCKALEYVFMLTKGEQYYSDFDSIRPASTGMSGGACVGRVTDPDGALAAGAYTRRYDRLDENTRGFRNTDLWFQSVATPHGMVGVGDELVGLDITTTGTNSAHYATFPARLVEPLIMCSTSEHGCCATCGTPWGRVVFRQGAVRHDGDSGIKRDRSYGWSRNGVDSTLDSGIAKRTTVGWQKVCGCATNEVLPCIVLDPFVGSGTTVATALQLGRSGIGIDLSESYLRDDAIPRIEAVTGRRRPTNAVPVGTRPPLRKLRD
jgi:DNA modification methylase